jgi:hypothetical protein
LNCDYTLISYAVRKKAKAKGYFWNTDKVEKLDLSNYNLGLNHSIKVFFYSKEGEYLNEYKTLAEAYRNTGISQRSIKNACILGTVLKN